MYYFKKLRVLAAHGREASGRGNRYIRIDKTKYLLPRYIITPFGLAVEGGIDGRRH